MKRWTWLIVGCLLALGIFAFTQNVKAEDRGCNITQFNMSPSGPNYQFGASISLSGKSN
jgi:hypothetical protein